MATLTDKIEIILTEEKRAYDANGRIRGGLGSFNFGLPFTSTTSGQIPELLAARSQARTIQSRLADTLLTLFSSLPPDEKNSLKWILRSHLAKTSPYCRIGYFIFFALYKIGALRDAVEASLLVLKGDSENAFDNAMGMLALIITYEYECLDDETYVYVDSMLRGGREYDFWVKDRLNGARLKIIEKELTDINPEINTDRDKVVSLWEEKFGQGPIVSLIKEIDSHFDEGEFTSTKYATCIDRVRVLLSAVFGTIAKSLSDTRRDGKITDRTDEHAAFDYLRTIGFLADYDWNIVRSLYDLASDQGSHKPVALREYARIAKNVTYEVVLLALMKYESTRL